MLDQPNVIVHNFQGFTGSMLRSGEGNTIHVLSRCSSVCIPSVSRAHLIAAEVAGQTGIIDRQAIELGTNTG